jgi:hypothetical protein
VTAKDGVSIEDFCDLLSVHSSLERSNKNLSLRTLKNAAPISEKRDVIGLRKGIST